MAHRLESFVFEAWKELTLDSRALRARGFARWQNAAAAKAIDKWREHSDERARMVSLGRQLLGRYLNGLLARMLTAWIEHAQGSKERKAYVESKVLSMMTGRGVRSATHRAAPLHSLRSLPRRPCVPCLVDPIYAAPCPRRLE